jgi:hypothetical protein
VYMNVLRTITVCCFLYRKVLEVVYGLVLGSLFTKFILNDLLLF